MLLGSQEKYEELFSLEDKAKAFDMLAQNYYFGNFGTMQKSDFDLLMFSIYLERILEKSEDEIETFSDYELSKLLGITQSRVSTLKVKKQLRYPYKNFDWKASFQNISRNARYENGKIRIHIPDKNVFLELQNAVEKEGGYVDVQLNSKLLQLTPENFVRLMVAISDGKDEETVRKEIMKELKKASRDEDMEYLETQTVEEQLKKLLLGNAADIVSTLIKRCIGL